MISTETVLHFFLIKSLLYRREEGKGLLKVNILPSDTAIKWQNWDANPASAL